MSDMFGNLFSGPGGFGGPETEKGVPWEAKEIDGKIYLPAEQVVEVLKINDVLPKTRAALERHLK